MKKNIFYFLLILFSMHLNAQVRASIDLGLYRHTDFKESGYIQGGLGLEVKAYKFLKPEVAVSYYYGSLEDHNKLDALGNTTSAAKVNGSALNFGFTPKICLSCGEYGAGDALLQILPIYNISRIEAQQNYTTINQNNPSQSKTEKDIVTEWQQSLGIGIGVDIILSDKNYDSLAVNLYYTGVNMGKALGEVESTETRYDSRTLGFGLNYYFGFKKKID
ncbi:hypothetical protein L1276_004955 [Flavobacterium sp. HSC-32F16]|uniref:hypothetical protein n=1 Tax=Flavobacterium sp. HSC-32F16 TaxID=2910964 RepID=UPI0020A47648|nr:hypothetical protein [Flavobacterium sp. HSC-32F16]MCP2029761.1 hypothetical protein [Flavobacterium sp. HSC-32F16]